MADKWEGKIVVPTGGYVDAGNFTLTEVAGGGAQDITITAGTYWWSSGSGNDMPEQIKADLETASGNGQTYTVAVAAGVGGTGKLTISSTAAFTITWGSVLGATFRNLCGFAGADTGSSTSHTGANQVRSLWLPGSPVNALFGTSTSGKVRYAGSASLAPDGTYSAIVAGSGHTLHTYAYSHVTAARTIIADESTTNESFERFWLDAIAAVGAWGVPGSQLRWYLDADTDATYKTFNALQINEPQYSRVLQNWAGMYQVALAVVLDA